MEEEIVALQARLAELEGARQQQEQASEFLLEILTMTERCKSLLVDWDEKVARHFLLCVKVISGEKLLVVFKGGFEREVRMS